MIPVLIKVLERKYLFLKWDDDSESKIELSLLRRFCPCAICTTEQETHRHDYIKVFSEQQLTVSNIQTAGNYAINVVWADGHNTGFYDFNYLNKLSKS